MIRGFIPLPVYLLILIFLYIRISRGLGLSKKARRYLIGFFVFIPFFFVLHAFLDEKIYIKSFYYINGFLMGAIFIGGCIFVAEFIFSRFFSKQQKLLVLIALVITLGGSGYALLNGLAVPKVKEITIPIKKLPIEISGFTIVHLSDLHINVTTSRKWLTQIVNTTNNLNPHLIVITGDLIGGINKNIEQYSKLLGKLKAKEGIFAVTGNHEFDNSGRTFQRILQGTRIKVLKNQLIKLRNGLQIAGIDDRIGVRTDQLDSWPFLSETLKSRDQSKPVVLLCHRPQVFDKAREFKVDLLLSGHTHAGQLPPLSVFSSLIHKYNSGFYKKDGSILYVSSGTGTWEYLPLRMFTSNVIIKINLVKSPNVREGKSGI
jgi:predicted MPP superfamily phosphohydrolase